MGSLKRMMSCARKRLVSLWRASFAYKAMEDRISDRFRRRLKNDGFTILCSNCVGGIIYHRLGKQFLSPTINLNINQPDFVSFCLHLDYYLGKELVFVESEYDFPVAKLEGNGRDIPTITILFLHYKDESSARECWEKRKTRIRRDNLFIMLYKLDGVTVEELRELENVPCRNKVVFTAEPLPEIPWSFYIKPNMRHRLPYSYLQSSLFGLRYFERKFDFVSFLNCANDGTASSRTD